MRHEPSLFFISSKNLIFLLFSFSKASAGIQTGCHTQVRFSKRAAQKGASLTF
jgi:hypothetical protein